MELKDARTLKAPVTVELPRPQVTLLSKAVQDDSNASATPVQLGSLDDLPVEGKLVFFLKSIVPAAFPRDEKVEVASADGSFQTTLALSDGSLMLENADTAEGSIEPLARFGFSAFGPVRVRAISNDGAAGDWLPLGTLVRLPGFKELRCPRSVSKPCLLSGSNLFLAESFASAPTFDNPVEVPPEFTGIQFVVPHPANGVLYVKLRDDPATVQTFTLPVTLISLPSAAIKALPAIPPPAPAEEPAAPTAAPPAAPAAAPPAETSPTSKPAPSTSEPPSSGPSTPAAPNAEGPPAGGSQTPTPAPNSN